MMDYYDKGGAMRSDEEYESYAAKYREWWQPYEQQILTAMCETLGLEFKLNIIDVYVAPFFYSFSDPLVLGVQFDTQEKLVLNLTHELIHKLLMDNTTHDDSKTISEWTNLFGEHDFETLTHIPIHAILHKIFIDIVQRPDMLDAEIRDKKSYKDSWEYVEQCGYDTIVEQLIQLYKS